MAKSILTVRVDPETKAQARRLAQDAGLSLSHLVDMQLQKLIAQYRLGHDSSDNLNPKFAKKLTEIDKDIVSNHQIEGPFQTPEDLFKSLGFSPDEDV